MSSDPMSTDSLDGRFTMKGPLRCGGVGSLLCAEDKDGARTAIRMIPQMAQGEEAVAAALRMPLHPMLPRTVGSGLLEDSSWVAIDFPEGELLTNRISLTTPALLTMGSMIAGALSALHQNNIVHGEMSTDSVLVVPGAGGDRFVLFDAPLVVINRLSDRRGEERLLSQLTHLVPFLSPERARGVDANFASDIWSLGMIISLASGAKAIPGDSTLEKIASIVTNKWRPSVAASLPIALRLLLTRMLAPQPQDRPTALEAATELEHLTVALTAHKNVTPHAAPAVVTQPVPPARLDKLVAQAKAADPFDSLVAKGVSAVGPDVHTEPTKRTMIPGHDVTDPHSAVVLPVPTAPSVPVWNEPSAAPIQLLIPAHPSQQQRRMPLPPILDPQAVVVARPPPVAVPQVDTLPDPSLPQKPQATTLPFGVNRPAASLPSVMVSNSAAMEVPAAAFDAPSVHDQAEDAFAADVRRTQKRRLIALAIAAGVVILGAGGFVLKSQFESEPEVERVRVPRPRKVAAVEVAPDKTEPVMKAEPPANAEPVVKAEPVVQAEPATKAEPVVKAEPAPKAEPVKAAPAKAEPIAKTEPVAARPAAAPRPVKQPAAVRKTEDAPRRPASRLDEGD